MTKSGVQNRKRILMTNPIVPFAKAVDKIPRAATTLRFDVSEGSEDGDWTRRT